MIAAYDSKDLSVPHTSPGQAVGRPAALLLLLAVLVTNVLSVGCSARTTTQAVPGNIRPAVASSVPRPDHIVVVMMENKNRAGVIGASSAPYLNSLASRGANLSQSYGVTHPSQGNYVALFSGGLQGVTGDGCPYSFPGTDNLGHQLFSHGLSFTGYAESMPSPGYTGCSAGKLAAGATSSPTYRRKHNGWVDFPDLPGSANQPFSAFPTDYTKLPTVSFVSPNMCHDMHDCSVASGDGWLKDHLGAYATWAQSHHSLLVVTFDENSSGTVNQIATVVVGQSVRPGSYAEPTNHYGVLRTIEDAYGLPPLVNAAQVSALHSIWTTSPSGDAVATGLRNPSFELGLADWATSGSTAAVPTTRHGGTLNARAGTTKATRGDSILSQTIVVPAGRTKLSVWWLGRCHDVTSRAWATIIVKRNTSHKLSTLLPRTCAAKGSWHQVQLAVAPGHSYTVQLVSHDDGVRATPNLTYFDDVALS